MTLTESSLYMNERHLMTKDSIRVEAKHIAHDDKNFYLAIDCLSEEFSAS